MESCYVAQAGHKPSLLLSQPAPCWDGKYAPPPHRIEGLVLIRGSQLFLLLKKSNIYCIYLLILPVGVSLGALAIVLVRGSEVSLSFHHVGPRG